MTHPHKLKYIYLWIGHRVAPDIKFTCNYSFQNRGVDVTVTRTVGRINTVSWYGNPRIFKDRSMLLENGSAKKLYIIPLDVTYLDWWCVRGKFAVKISASWAYVSTVSSLSGRHQDGTKDKQVVVLVESALRAEDDQSSDHNHLIHWRIDMCWQVHKFLMWPFQWKFVHLYRWSWSTGPSLPFGQSWGFIRLVINSWVFEPSPDEPRFNSRPFDWNFFNKSFKRWFIIRISRFCSSYPLELLANLLSWSKLIYIINLSSFFGMLVRWQQDLLSHGHD